MRLLILVGLTGTGKTTTVNALHDAGLSFDLLPNRRQLTDDLIINHLQEMDGDPVMSVTDRTARFAYTRRYRELYSGGMAHALQQLIMNNELPIVNEDERLVFDGLRGANEVIYAAKFLPEAWFLFLDAPDFVRVERLLGRGDVFDQVRVNGGGGRATAVVPQLARNILTSNQTNALLALVAQGQISHDDLIAKLTIVHNERQNYDPDATLSALRQHAPDRLIYADTTQLTPQQIAQKTISELPS